MASLDVMFRSRHCRQTSPSEGVANRRCQRRGEAQVYLIVACIQYVYTCVLVYLFAPRGGAPAKKLELHSLPLAVPLEGTR